MSFDEIGVQIERFSQLFQGLVVVPAEIQIASQNGADDEAQRLLLQSSGIFGGRVFRSANGLQVHSMKVHRRGILGIDLEGALEFTLAARPIPIATRLS